MQIPFRIGRRPLVTLLLLLVLSGSPVAGSGTFASSAQETAATPAIDLAAMTLSPADLDRAGLPGFGFDSGHVIFPDDLAAFVANSRGLSDDEARTLVGESGYRRWYESYLYLPADAQDPLGAVSSTVSSYIVEFADAEGAAAAWSWLEDESGDPSAEDVPLPAGLGDQAEATRYIGEDPLTGEPVRELDLTVRDGNLNIGVRLAVMVDVEPDLDTAEALLTRLMERVSTAREGDGAGLSTQSLRLSGTGVEPSVDGYVLLDGKATRLLGETDTDVQERESATAAQSLVDTYRVWQIVAPGGDQPERAVWYFLEIQRFSNDAEAAAWLDGHAERMATNPMFTDLTVDSAAPTFGDQSMVYTIKAAEFPVAYRSVALRVGSTVAVIDVEGPGSPPAEVIMALARAQEACLVASVCLDPLPVPPSLTGYITGLRPTGEAPQETPVPPATPTPSSGANVYESPGYGYTLTYDPAMWQLSEAETDDATEWVTLDSESSTVNIVGRPSSVAGDLESCVESYLLDYGWDDGAWEATLIEPLLVESDSVRGTYALADQIFGGTAYMSVECRAIGGGNTLMITNFAFTDEGETVPEAEVARFDELIAGLQVSGPPPAATVVPSGEYTSPTWGFTVKWNPSDWVVADASREDGIELHLNGSVLVMAKVDAVVDYGGDPQACLQALAEPDSDTPLVPSTRYAAPATVEGAVGGVYELGDFGVMYFECRTLIPGQAVLEIRFGAPSVDYEATRPALEALLPAITIGRE